MRFSGLGVKSKLSGVLVLGHLGRLGVLVYGQPGTLHLRRSRREEQRNETVSFGFVWFSLVPFGFGWFGFASFRFVSFHNELKLVENKQERKSKKGNLRTSPTKSRKLKQRGGLPVQHRDISVDSVGTTSTKNTMST